MSAQIMFFEKNKLDLDFGRTLCTASENPELANYAVNRKNTSAWQTDASLDANNTTYTGSFGRVTLINAIILIGINFKDFDVEYFDGAAWNFFTDQATGGNSSYTDNTKTDVFIQTEDVENAEKIRITIKKTITANDAKVMVQFIATELLGQLEGWPVIDRVKVGRETDDLEMLDGLVTALDRQGGYSGRLGVTQYTVENDINLLHSLQNRADGFLYWPCGGDITQFNPVTEGYRFKDIYLCRFFGQWEADYYKGLYPAGIRFSRIIRQVHK